MTGTDNRKKNNMKQKRSDTKKEQRSEFFQGLLLLYFVLCFFITAVARQKHILTYSQISMIYLPLLVIFCIWQTKKYLNPGAAKRPSKTRTILSVGLCAFTIIITLVINIANLIY